MASTKSIAALFIFALAVMVALGACSDHGVAVRDNSLPLDSIVSFAAEIHPLLLNSCGLSGCHIGANPQHEFSVATYATITEVSHQGRHVVPGYADSSALYIAVTPQYAEIGLGQRMPFGRTPLTLADQNKIRNWINQGAADN